ncbi:MAG: ATP-grasp domain-containing protein [Elusimicrobia bacterium]|nr:ATP-grasp domain-containing protein [Elusimicrobiota bacterium]
MKTTFNILITGIGSTTAIGVIKALKKQNEFKVFIIGTDINEKENIAGSKFCDKFFQIPPATNEESYLNALNRIVNSESIDLLIPIIDIELEVIARNRNIIKKSTYLLVSSYKTIVTCNDKIKTYGFFKNFRIPTPQTFLIDNLNSTKDILANADINFPLILKPRKGLSSRDVYEIYNEEELCLIKRLKEPIIQEKAKGEEYTIDIFCDGENLISAVPRKRIDTRAGISYKGKTEKDEILINYAKKISEELHINGPANIQCFKKGDEIKFLEINPRFSGGLPLSIAAGINTPLFALKMAAGEKIKPVNDFKIVKMCRYWEEVFYYE